MIIKFKKTSKNLLKEKRICYKSSFAFDKKENSYRLVEFNIYEISKSNYLVYVNGIMKFGTYCLDNAKNYCYHFCDGIIFMDKPCDFIS